MVGAERHRGQAIRPSSRGGMRKRVGIARAIALKPRYILYDEPTSGLDPVTSAVMDQLMVRTRDLGVTGLVVTHDMRSAFSVGDRIAMLHEGRIRQVGTRARDPGHRRPGGAPVHRGPARRAGQRRRHGGRRRETQQRVRGRAGGAAALALVVGRGALAERDRRQPEEGHLHQARFRTVGGLGVGAPVTLRGSRSAGSRPSAWSRTSGWRPSSASTRTSSCPRKPAVISASASLFGEWSANIISYEPPPTDPNLRGRAGRVRPGRRRRLARRHPPRHRPADRAGQPHRRRRGRRHPADQPGLRQHRAQEHAEEREGPGRDLGPAGRASPTPRPTASTA